MNLKKLVLILFAIIVFGGNVTAVYAANENLTNNESECTINGSWYNLSWMFKNGKLMITGIGDMEVAGASSDAAEEYPWKEYKNVITDLVVGEGITSIGADAFGEFKSLRTINLPSSLTKIESLAFTDCDALNRVELPENVTEIGNYAFSGSGLKEVLFSKNSKMVRVGDYAFHTCENLEKVVFHQKLERIGEWSFANCKALADINFPDNLNAIEEGAFYNCDALKEPLVLAENINSIGNCAFQDCDNLDMVEIYGEVSIGDEAFEGCNNLTTLKLGDKVKEVRFRTFYGCFSLQDVIIGSGLEKIGTYAFFDCSALTSFKIYSMNTGFQQDSFPSFGKVVFYAFEGSTAERFANGHIISYEPLTTLEVPTNRKIVNVVSGVHVYWNDVIGVKDYTLYRSQKADCEYKQIKVNITNNHFIDTTAQSGKTYYYKVVAKNNSASSEMTDAQRITFVETPDITSRYNKAAGITLGWNKVNGATGYAIYRKPYNGTTWTRVATINGNNMFSWSDTTVKNNNGTVYKYTIRALTESNKATLSGCRSTGRTMVRLTSRIMNSTVKTSNTSIKCMWTTSSAVSGYEVRFMIGDEVYKTYNIGDYKIGTKTFKGIAKGTDYKIQVRSYKKVENVGTFYSAWSVPKQVSL